MIPALLLVTVLHADPLAGDWVAHRSLAAFSSTEECIVRALAWVEFYESKVFQAKRSGSMLDTQVSWTCRQLV